MIRDIWTVMGKDLREVILMTGGRSRLGLLFSLAIFGVLIPVQAGRLWIESPVILGYWAWVPLYMTNGVVADSFAGERERHTLETLLASRLSDRGILMGKIGAAVAFGWGLTMANVLAGLVTVNVVYGRGELVMYQPPVALGIVCISLLMSTLAAMIGVLISLRAATVRQASQVVSIALTVLFLIPLVTLQLLPEASLVRLVSSLESTNWALIGALSLGLVIGLIVGLFLAILARFKRARLILD